MSINTEIDDVFRDNVIKGDIHSGANLPDKPEIRRLLKKIAGGTEAVGEYRGEWDSEAEYIKSDFVREDGSLWLALRPNSGVTPVEGDDWTLLMPAVSVPDGSIGLVQLAAAVIADFRMVDPNGPRIPMRYYGATQVQISAQPSFPMGGFRFQGRCSRDRVPLFPAPTPTDGRQHIMGIGNGSSTQGDLAYETTSRQKTWYAFWACADDGDPVAQFKATPLLKAGSVAGSVITLAVSGEGDYGTGARTHSFGTNGLVGAEVLVITETINTRANAWSGRIAKVTANTTSTITLDQIGNIGAHDYILVAPPFDHFHYLGARYFEAGAGSLAELRNFSDDGRLIKTRGVNLGTGAGWATGAIAQPGNRVTPRGDICPLATGIVMRSTISLSTSSGGAVGEYYAIDSGLHDVWNVYRQKISSSSETYVEDGIEIPLMFGPEFYLWTAGSLEGVRAGALIPTGWIEL